VGAGGEEGCQRHRGKYRDAILRSPGAGDHMKPVQCSIMKGQVGVLAESPPKYGEARREVPGRRSGSPRATGRCGKSAGVVRARRHPPAAMPGRPAVYYPGANRRWGTCGPPAWPGPSRLGPKTNAPAAGEVPRLACFFGDPVSGAATSDPQRLDLCHRHSAGRKTFGPSQLVSDTSSNKSRGSAAPDGWNDARWALWRDGWGPEMMA